MPLHYVILHHTGFGDEHWDLMLESGDVLHTWQLPQEPTSPADLPMPARRIGDHRKAYLSYEGPVSGGRGQVRRCDAGSLDWLKNDVGRFDFTLLGGRLRGFFSLTAANDHWNFSAM